jgi:hypothetical protein
MQLFCTVEQYEAKFGPVDDEGVLTECLGDASAVIRRALTKAGIGYADPDEDLADRMMRACRSMANRCMPSTDIPVGATQASTVIGPFSQQYTLGKAYGTPMLQKSECELLGIHCTARSTWPYGGADA